MLLFSILFVIKYCFCLSLLHSIICSSDTECAICNDKLKDAVALPCLHTFCYLCVAAWFTESKKCPVCNNDIPGDFELPSDEIIR